MKLRTKFLLLLLPILLWNHTILAQDSLYVRALAQINFRDAVDSTCSGVVWCSGIALVDSHAYIAAGCAGLHMVNVAHPAQPAEVGAFSTTPDFATAVAVAGTYAFVCTAGGGPLYIVNIANPAVPVLTGLYHAPNAGILYDVAVSGHYAYLVDQFYGLRVVDVADPAAPVTVGSCYLGDQSLGIAINGNYALVAVGGTGLRSIDISNPAAPVPVGLYYAPAYVYDVTVCGNYAYLAGGTSGLRIINISNPVALTEVGFFGAHCSVYNAAVCGGLAFVADAYSGLRIANISNPAAPVEVGFYDTPGNASGVVANGGTAYVADFNCVGIYDCSRAIENSLPVEFLGLTAVPSDGSVTLNWRTASEHNNARFEIERDGHIVGVENGQGSSASEHAYSWTDTDLQNGRIYRYALYSVATDEAREMLWSAEATPAANGLSAVTEYSLHEAYPNPFNPVTNINYDLFEAGWAQLRVYNLMGQKIATLVNGFQTAGKHTVNFDAAGLPSGTYVYRLDAVGFSATRKMLLLK